MHDAVRHAHVGDFRQCALGRLQMREQRIERQGPRVELHLQRPDARRQVEHAGQTVRVEPAHQRMHAKTQVQVEHERPVFHQHVAVARAPVDDAEAAAGRRVAMQHAVVRHAGGCRARNHRVGGKLGRHPGAHELHRITRPQLPELPQFVVHDRHRTHEAAEARAVQLRITGMSPVKSTAPIAYALSWIFEGCRPASPPSARAHCGFGPISRMPVRLEL